MGITPFVRVPHQCGNGFVQKVLDGGAMGVIFPHITNAKEAKDAVSISKYPPQGCRSMTGQLPVISLKTFPQPQVIRETNASGSTVFVMIENASAVENVDDIAAVEGVDVVLVGSNDLAIELGIPGEFRHETFRHVLTRISEACKKHGKIMGLAGIYDQPDIHDWAIHKLGVRFLLCQQDSGLIAGGAAKCLAGVEAVEITSSSASNISENQLNELKRKAEEWDDMHGPAKKTPRPSGSSGFLGPSSTWAYSRHVMVMIRQYVNQETSPEIPLNIDGAAFNIELPRMTQAEAPINIESLPSLDYAIYLTNTVKFHIAQTYHIFDEVHFMRGLLSLYNDGPPPLSAENQMWYIQYFLVMALGKGLLTRGMSKAGSPGSEYFLRAMELFPDASGLYEDPLLSIEVCCGLALYLQSVDHRNSAYVYLGLGLRIALSQGLHRDIVGEFSDDNEVKRYRNAWWTLYILDRKFSSLMGAPSSVHDSDISVPVPGVVLESRKSNALDMHIKLSRLIAKVLNTVYGIDGRLDDSFPKNTLTILKELAALASEWSSYPDLKLDGQGPVSRVSATLNLCYHQCIVLATRPVLMCLLRDKLELDRRQRRSTFEIAEPIKALLKACYDSAHKSLRILATLQSQDLLELFLPFDLDHAFSAGFVLALISAVQPFPDAVCEPYFEATVNILDTLIAGGNLPARFRRQEIERLHDMLHLIDQQESASHPNGDQVTGFVAQQGEQGISPSQLLNVTNMLDCCPPLNLDLDAVNSWLWESATFETGGQ
ncbi:transcriptional regulatory [Fusarium sporotrichioides]|uniref:Transcriptional regulatory n=1 Tax=Fusarium sporotrichioides TaxID=5514 RepID=A0A395RVS5_FUSSP|nr:transcriptional regulatory [Fusarium sporotrichioides]